MKKEAGVLNFRIPICVSGFSSVVGEIEGNGPLKDKFDEILKGNMFGETSFEKAESKMQKIAVKIATQKAKVTMEDVDVIFAGDLLNQCIGSNYGLKSLKTPFVGLYGACSTIVESVLVSCVFLQSELIERAVCVTSSHFCAAERQFRFPLEYGGQKKLTSQRTATGAGAIVLEKGEKQQIFVRGGCIGKILDFGVKDMNNMGAAMAPAAFDTITRFFEATKTCEKDYDLILTGDLGETGSRALQKLMAKKGINLKEKHKDCGLLLYDSKKQHVHCGGSGAGCPAIVFCSDILQKLSEKKLNNILFAATGALMSKTASNQKRSIPSISHLVNFSCNL